MGLFTDSLGVDTRVLLREEAIKFLGTAELCEDFIDFNLSEALPAPSSANVAGGTGVFTASAFEGDTSTTPSSQVDYYWNLPNFLSIKGGASGSWWFQGKFKITGTIVAGDDAYLIFSNSAVQFSLGVKSSISSSKWMFHTNNADIVGSVDHSTNDVLLRVTRDGTTTRFYVDGVLAGSSASAYPTADVKVMEFIVKNTAAGERIRFKCDYFFAAMKRSDA